MTVEAHKWFVYADENLAVARMALKSGYYNACLQNIQQAVEKFLKAALLSKNVTFEKTHSIATLNRQLVASGVETLLSEEECELLDTIYLPSKYPMGSALPAFHPDEEIGRQCVEIADKIRQAVQPLIAFFPNIQSPAPAAHPLPLTHNPIPAASGNSEVPSAADSRFGH